MPAFKAAKFQNDVVIAIEAFHATLKDQEVTVLRGSRLRGDADVVRQWPQFFAIDGVSDIEIHRQRQDAVYGPQDERLEAAARAIREEQAKREPGQIPVERQLRVKQAFNQGLARSFHEGQIVDREDKAIAKLVAEVPQFFEIPRTAARVSASGLACSLEPDVDAAIRAFREVIEAECEPLERACAWWAFFEQKNPEGAYGQDEADRLEALGVLSQFERGLLEARRREAAETAAAKERWKQRGKRPALGSVERLGRVRCPRRDEVDRFADSRQNMDDDPPDLGLGAGLLRKTIWRPCVDPYQRPTLVSVKPTRVVLR
jgi:hypothetical protein